MATQKYREKREKAQRAFIMAHKEGLKIRKYAVGVVTWLAVLALLIFLETQVFPLHQSLYLQATLEGASCDTPYYGFVNCPTVTIGIHYPSTQYLNANVISNLKAALSGPYPNYTAIISSYYDYGSATSMWQMTYIVVDLLLPIGIGWFIADILYPEV